MQYFEENLCDQSSNFGRIFDMVCSFVVVGLKLK